jgi:hypothetical protein
VYRGKNKKVQNKYFYEPFTDACFEAFAKPHLGLK